ncbi:G-protein coupled receptors family 1 profile domain-containing protein [Caenorhabditis elegans]|uniref:G-protein coupled receptors family 1 profile domain-containing protein n=1 Tax=Caenorhabditis elegans TaxID=6239 RepID=O61876_CAEEL|nr:G-protein coupled receptors family 1 profile domain-containing protein [Caenorhabditis elegans]CCD72118.1 G-protein coupled receptors family 1 profile domain-containing protein [Caenorhabditis elegans]|eukprot:NP_504016.2 Serpentine Receptor, class X [Caenorhabditis elegans]
MSQEYNYTDPLNLVVAFLLGTIGTFGVVCNSLIVYIFLKEKSEQTAFNVICFFRAISNVIILTTIFLITYLPKTLLGYSPYPPAIESWFINTSHPLYLGNEYQIVLMAINRFCAMFFPTKYSRIFSLSHTTIILVLIYLYRIAQKIYEWLPESAKGCYTLFSTKYFAWKYSSAPGCDYVDGAPEVIKYTFITTAFLNFITFLKILHFYKKSNSSQVAVEAKKRMRKNILNFIQTILLDSLYLIDITFTFELSSWSTRRVWTYFCGTFIWECLHSLDGFIMIIFNEKLTFLRSKTRNKVVLPIIGGGHPRQGQTSVTTYSNVK